ncbi:MAG: aspartate/glutamate racemase family protein [Bacteroidota bacterium]|nr:aspartate/glutamate racemase family protein [Bacteroidota bacterium]
MKTIGLIGGTSWISTVDYYRAINELTNQRLGALHSAKLLLYSVDFEEYRPDKTTDWIAKGKAMGAIARRLQDAGADCLLLGANTMHMMADTVQRCIDIPLIHIVTETARAVSAQGMSKVALLGTRTTMEEPFFADKLREHGIEGLIPSPEDRDFINGAIFTELNKGIFREETRKKFVSIIEKLAARGADAAILGCTEFPLLIKPEDSPVPLFDTAAIHARAAVDFALSGDRVLSERV